MQPRAIHQFHSGSAVGDAVTNSLFFTRALLREMGFQSEIYVQHVAPELCGELLPHADYRGSSDQVLLVHHSMGHDLTDWLIKLPDRKILVYHNITPPTYFDCEYTKRYIAAGFHQLTVLLPHLVSAIADSEKNATDLKEYGYQEAAVIPLLIDIGAAQKAPYRADIVHQNSPVFTILFVGRISRNKCQHDLIRLFTQVHPLLKRPSQLVLVGGYDANGHYYHELQQLRLASGLADKIHIMGKLPDDELWAWYRSADIFVCMSEHEGFCVPLIEAMLFDLPILAFKSTAVPQTLGQGGLLFTSKSDFAELAFAVKLFSEDHSLRRVIIASQRERLKDFTRERIKSDLTRHFVEHGIAVPSGPSRDALPKRLAYQIEGPVETSYSLAIVNRELALALGRAHPDKVGIFVTEGPGDYEPNADLIRRNPVLEELWHRGKKGSAAQVVIRNLHPPRVADMDGCVNLLSFGWEESVIPCEWIDNFNTHLDGAIVPSAFVKKTMIDNGFLQPVVVYGHGIDHVKEVPRKPLHMSLGKGFKFLHVSSCFPRKGVDVLLSAFADTFEPSEDVTLVIKTFPNIHNTVEEQMQGLRTRRGNAPRIILINRELEDGEMVDLYGQCDALVLPSRGEGFGLPLAEAMLHGMPIITTGFGGQRDFCTPETSWLVDFRFAKANTHLTSANSLWVEPDRQHLGRLMRELVETPPSRLRVKSTMAQRYVSQNLTWDRCACQVDAFVNQIDKERPLQGRTLRVGWVSTWNTRCGIAAYSRYLLEELMDDGINFTVLANHSDQLDRADESFVRRCWEASFNRPEQKELLDSILDAACEVVVIQFNFGFFKLSALAKLIDRLTLRATRVLVVFHSTQDVNKPDLRVSLRDIAGSLRKAHRLLVHSLTDVNRLLSFGLVDNVTLFPHGVQDHPKTDRHSLKVRLGFGNKTVIGSYGFLLPHKGILELIEAFALMQKELPDSVLLLVNALYPSPSSTRLLNDCQSLAKELGVDSRVIRIHEFLPDDESRTLLEAADVVVFPYQNTNESSSAAVRLALAAHAPIACTPLGIFEDIDSVHVRLPGTKPDQIAAGLLDFLKSQTAAAELSGRLESWLKEHSWERCALRLKAMLLDAERRGTGVT